MPDYNKTKIYKLFSPSNVELTYYGHTTKTIQQRLLGHLRQYRFWMNNPEKVRKILTFSIFENCDDYVIELIEDYPCNTRTEALMREAYYIQSNKCLNVAIPYKDPAIRKEERKEYDKAYHIKNADKIQQYKDDNRDRRNESARQKYADNKEMILEKQKERYEENKEIILEKQKKYRDDNKLSIANKQKQRMICECGKDINRHHKSRHLKSLEHIQFIQLLSPSSCSSNTNNSLLVPSILISTSPTNF